LSLSPERAGRLTASVFANAIGIGYDSRQKLWRQLTEREERFQGNAATEWGSANEKNAIQKYEIVTGEIVESAGGRQGFVIHPEHDWLGCTPDGFVGQTVIEAKCPASLQVYGKVPDHYMPQLQGQMAITGKSLAHFICWTPEEFEVWEVPADNEYWTMCFELLTDFWSCVKNDEEPKKRKKPTLPTITTKRIYHATID
jgi:putative phage-type endonuclease